MKNILQADEIISRCIEDQTFNEEVNRLIDEWGGKSGMELKGLVFILHEGEAVDLETIKNALDSYLSDLEDYFSSPVISEAFTFFSIWLARLALLLVQHCYDRERDHEKDSTELSRRDTREIEFYRNSVAWILKTAPRVRTGECRFPPGLGA